MEDPVAIRTQADGVLRNSFGIQPPTSSLQMQASADWRQVQSKRNLSSNAVGVYCIAERIAHVLQENNRWIATLYHEVHGHALFYEQSVIGKRHKTSYLPFDKQIPPDLTQWGVPGTHRHNSEGFATWMERYLCEATGRERLWQGVKERMPADYREAYEAAAACASTLSPAGFLRQMGIPVPITPTRASGILRAMSAGRRVDLAAILPPARAEDPVRVLIVSDDRPPIRPSPWLAPRVIDSGRLITETVQKDRVLEREATAGEFLFGDAYAWQRIQDRFSKRPPIG